MEKNIVKGNIMAEYMVLKNNVVEAIYCGEIKNGENIIILPENHEVRVGENIAFYNDDYTRKSDIELILSNLKDVPLGYKLENNQLIEMTYEEQVTAGIKDLPPYYKIENNALVEMAEHEKLELMTKAEKARDIYFLILSFYRLHFLPFLERLQGILDHKSRAVLYHDIVFMFFQDTIR